MAGAFVKEVGRASGTGGAVSLVLTLAGGGVPAGNKVQVGWGSNGLGTDADDTIVDSKGNSWTLDLSSDVSVSGNRRLRVWSSVITTPLVNGDTITINCSAGPGRKAMMAFEFSGLQQTAGGDRATSLASSSSTAPTSGATAQRQVNDELLTGWCIWNGAATGDTFTGGASYLGTTQIESGLTATWRYLAFEYRFVSVKGTDVADGVIGPAARAETMGIVTYAVAGAAGLTRAKVVDSGSISDIAITT